MASDPAVLADRVTDQLAALAAGLREQGSRVGIGELLTAHRALEAVDCTSREDARLALRAVLCSERDLGLSDEHEGLLELRPGELSPEGRWGRPRSTSSPKRRARHSRTRGSRRPRRGRSISTRSRPRCPPRGAMSSCCATRISPPTRIWRWRWPGSSSRGWRVVARPACRAARDRRADEAIPRICGGWSAARSGPPESRSNAYGEPRRAGRARSCWCATCRGR